VVRGECLEFALKDEDAFFAGIWGGTTPKERRALQQTGVSASAHTLGSKRFQAGTF